MKNKDLSILMGLLYGGQDYDENYHHVAFSFDSLKRDLSEIGFNNFNLWDNDYFIIDDYSKSYLPHMDKKGQLMSLNIICLK
jgi:hypothetical protein